MNWRRLTRGLLLSLVASSALAEIRMRNWEDPDAPQWQEAAAALPAFPLDANLLPFYVGEMTAHSFFVDGSTLSVGTDGVVRYVLVIRTSGGATNISFEGIRCETREFKVYASGRADGTWAPVRKSEWRRVENKPVNRYHAALYRDLFCPNGGMINSADEGRNALRRGKHPEAM